MKRETGKQPFWTPHTPSNLEEIRGTARQAEEELERDRLAQRAKTVPEELAHDIDRSVRERIERWNRQERR